MFTVLAIFITSLPLSTMYPLLRRWTTLLSFAGLPPRSAQDVRGASPSLTGRPALESRSYRDAIARRAGTAADRGANARTIANVLAADDEWVHPGGCVLLAHEGFGYRTFSRLAGARAH